MKKKIYGKLKEKTTKELAILLNSGICGDEYKQVLQEYSSRPYYEKKHKSPSARYKCSYKQKHPVNPEQVNEGNISGYNVQQLRYLLPITRGKLRKLVAIEYANRIHQLSKSLS